MVEQRPRGLAPLNDITAEEWVQVYGSEDELGRVLERTRKMLELAQRGHADLCGDSQPRHLGGICDVAVYGRSVTFAAQHARTQAQVAFDGWYSPWENEMTKDDLFGYFNRLRTQVVHDGPPRAVAYRTSPKGREFFIATRQIIERALPQFRQTTTTTTYSEDPPGARVEAKGLHGETVMHWVPLPTELFNNHRWFTYLPDPPKNHLGNPIVDITLQGLSTLYIARLATFVQEFADFVVSQPAVMPPR